MLIKRLRIFILIALLLTLSLLTIGCTSTNQRVQEALNKSMGYTSMHIKGTGNASVEIVSLSQNINMDYAFDIKVKDEDLVMSMDTKSNIMDMNMEIYMVDDRILMYIPILFDKYIDASEMMDEIDKNAIGMDVSAFDFDVKNTELEPENTKIDFDGNEIDVMKVKVLLEEDELTDIIKKVFEQQNFSSDTLSGQSMQQTASLYESIDLSSAEYTLYIDNNNNIKRYAVDAEFTLDLNGEVALFDMKMIYDLIETGDSIVVEMPDVNQEDIVSMSELM